MNYTRLTVFAAVIAFPLIACGTADKSLRSSAVSSSPNAAPGATADAKTADAGPAAPAAGTNVESKAAPTNGTAAAADTSGQVSEDQMKTMLAAVAAKAAGGSASLVDQAPSSPADAAAALKTAFTAKLAANPGILTQAQADELMGQLNTFVAASTKMDAKASAAAWNTINVNLKKLKAARPASSALGLTDTYIKGSYSGGLLTNVLGILGGYNYVRYSPTPAVVVGTSDVAKTPIVGSSCGCRTGLITGVVGIAAYAVEDVLGLALGLVGAVLGVADAVVYTAADLVDTVFSILI